MVIKVNSEGVAIVAKWELHQIECDAGFRRGTAEDYRQVRKGGMRYYRRACIFEDIEHSALDGNYHDARKDPPQILMPCQCCYAEWLFTQDEIKEAVAAIRTTVENG